MTRHVWSRFVFPLQESERRCRNQLCSDYSHCSLVQACTTEAENRVLSKRYLSTVCTASFSAEETLIVKGQRAVYADSAINNRTCDYAMELQEDELASWEAFPQVAVFLGKLQGPLCAYSLCCCVSRVKPSTTNMFIQRNHTTIQARYLSVYPIYQRQ